MPNRHLFRFVPTVARALLAGAALIACATPKPGMSASMSTTTAADLLPPSPREARVDVDRPAGDLVCRTKDAFGVVTELYASGADRSASGALRRIAPSGMVTVERVRAERVGETIIADAPSETDLVVHAAVVHPRDGKRFMKLAEHGTWSRCE